MNIRARGLLLLLTAAVLLSSCSTTRYVPPGEYRLRKNVIVVDKEVAKEERISADELERYVRQTPNRKFLGTNFPLWAYNASDTAKNGWWHRTLRKIGTEPVVLDLELTERSAQNIRTYLRSKGYFDSRLNYTIDYKKRNAKVTYFVTQNEPYKIGEVNYYFRDDFIRPVIMQDTVSTLIRTGDRFDLSILNAERSRITEYLKNNGYYYFNVNNIAFAADSTKGGRDIDITMVVRQHLKEYDESGTPVYQNNSIYRLRDIYINPNYDAAAAASDPDYFNRLDTLEYRGLKVLYDGKPKVRPRMLRRAINLYPNYLYNAEEVQRAYSDIMRLGYYRSASIVFQDVSDDTLENLVTFIGGDEEDEFIETTTEGYLTCNINCIPSLRQSYRIDLEGSGTGSFYSVGATVGYQNRNLFRGAELFEISLTGRYEFGKSRKRSFEIGGSTSMSFPRFITPFKIDRYNRAVNPRTKFELSFNAQNREYYRRNLFGFRLGYSWRDRKYSSFTLRPLDINLVKVNSLDEGFLESLKNQYLRESYSEQLIAGLSGSYVYSNQLMSLGTTANVNSSTFRFNLESMGNIFYLLTHLFGSAKYDPKTDSDYHRIFGIRYSQYLRGEASFSRRIAVADKSAFVYRFLIGTGHAYGNSNSLPFDRLFFSGGPNSMRGWAARTLGPGGTFHPTDNDTSAGTDAEDKTDYQYNYRLGNFKLEANVEMRFPIWGFLHGAVFMDAGNVWYLKKGEEDDEASVFKFGTFARQLGLNTGVGLRLDFNFFVLRFDWGIKLHDPNKIRSERWIHGFDMKNGTALMFGVGYPF